MILEVVQGESGVNIGTAEFLHAAERLCRERGALLIVDEIQTGFGRTGRWFACEHAGIEPDIMCLAKGLGGGFPMGALAYTERVRDALYQGAHGSTFGGSPIACAAGAAALAAYRDEGLDRAQRGSRRRDARRASRRRSKAFRSCATSAASGLMLAIELRSKVAPVLKSLMVDHGVIALPAGPTVLRLLPPLVISREEIDLGVAAVVAAVGGAKRLMDRAAAIALIRGLVGIPSLSRDEPQRRVVARRRRCGAPATSARSWTRPATPSARSARLTPPHDRPAGPHRHRPRRHPGPHRAGR